MFISITGPIAAGKSTLAAALAVALRARGCSVVLVSLDAVADMARPTLPDWEWAHDLHARLAQGWAATEIDVVVDEGTETPEEVEQVLSGITRPVLRVVLTADLHASWHRALGEESRGISKDLEFLAGTYARFTAGMPRLEADLWIDVEQVSLEDQVARVLSGVVRGLPEAR